jgi:REP element-mobilizing transposase RayT
MVNATEDRILTTRPNVSHRKRETFQFATTHVSVRIKRKLPSLRNPKARAKIVQALHEFKDRFQCRIVEFSILSNHMHLIVEANNERELAKAMKGFLVRVAKALNKMWKRKGSVFADRYHVRIVKNSMSAVFKLRTLIRYVLQNARKHGIQLPPDRPDPYSSGPWYRSWVGHQGETFSDEPCPVQDPRFMELQCARRGTLELDERPSAYVPPAPTPGGKRKRRRMYTLR